MNSKNNTKSKIIIHNLAVNNIYSCNNANTNTDLT